MPEAALDLESKILGLCLEEKSAFVSLFFKDRFGESLVLRPFQKEIFYDDSQQIVVAAARDVGKTTLIEVIILYLLFHTRGKVILLVTPNQAHLNPLWDRLIYRLTGDEILSRYVSRITRAPDYKIEMITDTILFGRIAGTTSGNNFLGIHADYILGDEMQLFTGLAIDQLQGCMNKGYRLWVFGTPNGNRKSYLYKCFHDKTFKTYKINKWHNPDFTEEEYQRLAKIHGGESSQQFLNQVLAEFGAPQRQVFTERSWQQCLMRLENFVVDYIKQDTEWRVEDLTLPSPSIVLLPKEVIMSADIGYSPDPTVIGFFAVDTDGRAELFYKVEMIGIPYHIQSKLIDELARFYKCSILAIDSGGAGNAICLELEDSNLYPNKPYNIVPVKFGGTIAIGDTYEEREESVKVRIKSFSTILIQRLFEERKIIISEDDYSLIQELQEAVQSKTARGDYTYYGRDHHIDVLRLFAVSKYLTPSTESSEVVIATVEI